MRLVDADRILKKKFKFENSDGFRTGIYVVEAKAINDAPTVDAVPVVRCKDCIHWCATVTHSTMCDKYEPDAFCSHGERRENENC